jgi:hypothetical protein
MTQVEMESNVTDCQRKMRAGAFVKLTGEKEAGTSLWCSAALYRIGYDLYQKRFS